MLGGKKGLLGIDIGTSSLKIALVERRGKAMVVKELWEKEFPPDTIVEGEIMDRETVIQFVQEFLEERKPKTRDVSTFLPANKGVILKRIKIEKMPLEEAKESIKWNADQYIPYDPSEVSLDVAIVNPNAGENEMEAILIAARSDVLTEYISLLKEANLNPVIIDMSILALHNIYEINYMEKMKEEIVALIHIGKNFTHVIYTGKTGPIVYRDISFGTKDLIRIIQDRYGVTSAEAEKIIIGKEEKSLGEFKETCNSFSELVSSEIVKSFAYLPLKEKPDRIILSGGGSVVPEIEKIIEEKTAVPSEKMNVFNKIDIDEKLLAFGNIDKYNSLFPLAIGLSMRGVI
ncbi:MAG: type IV pilus assembly protein PilM [candidate division WOR-3 bacterium]